MGKGALGAGGDYRSGLYLNGYQGTVSTRFVMALPGLLINVVALLVACPGAALLSITRLKEQRAMARLVAQSDGYLDHNGGIVRT